MKITNKYGVPDAIWNAASNDKYSRGDADISVTQLIDAPQIARLRAKHHEDMEADVSDRMWALLGTAVHSLLEHAEDNQITEERLFMEVGGLKISGAIDVQEELPDGTIGITDFKVTSVTSVMYGKDSWVKQLNSYALLVRRNKNKAVSRLQICAIMRDWRRADSRRDSRYPASPILLIDIPVWNDLVQENYVWERAMLHKRSMEGEQIDCTDDDRWARRHTWAVKKNLNDKRARRVFEQEKEALDWAAKEGYKVEERPAVSVRCSDNYCQVREFCSQWKSMNQPVKIEEDFLLL